MTSFRFSMALPSESRIRQIHDEPPEATRERIVAMIARLVDMLDELDGDCDREEDDPPEPSLGWSTTLALGTADDREDDTAPIEGAKIIRLIS